jgi:ribosomal protein S18 acetylase RimI-like enzyme
MTYSIVPLTEALIPQVREVLDVVARERVFLLRTEASPLEKFTEYALGVINAGSTFLVVLNDANAVIGWCDVVPRQSHLLNAHVGSLGLGLLPAYRGQGIGRKLIEAALKSAFATHITRVELGVRANNINAKHLYESIGFQTEGCMRSTICLEGIYEDEYIMSMLKAE